MQPESTIEFHGDLITIGRLAVPLSTAEFWNDQGDEALLNHLLGKDGLSSSHHAYIGRLSDRSDANWLEGCELRNGVAELLDCNGEILDSRSTENEDFQQSYVDDVVTPSRLNEDVERMAEIALTTTQRGKIVYKLGRKMESFDDTDWYVLAADTGGEPFICEVNVDDRPALATVNAIVLGEAVSIST